ncbi:MAG TPA: hypothetical protein VNI57_05785 [Candidatus Saccharimonadales bacterium]|nr:hypothetical protein [Candidatus Saccharimonadales bacterium]
MALNPRDLPPARIRRWSIHAGAALAILASSWWAWSGSARLGSLEAALREAGDRIPVLEKAANDVASDCGIEPFSDPESLRRFPMKVGPRATRRETECARRVTKARSDLIETYLAMDRLRPLVSDAREAASPRGPAAGVVLLAAGAWLYASEIRPRRMRRG